jgi:hypothetical protein
MLKKYYARYNCYGIQITGDGEQVHVFSDKQSRDKWVNACNQKAEERGAVTAESITAKQATKLIKLYIVTHEHNCGKVYVKDNYGRILNESVED